MTDQTGPILCGKCHVTPERGFERNGETWAACSICGREDRVEDIMREAAKYTADKSVRGMFSGLAGSGMSVESPPERDYRWVTNS